MLYMIQLCTKVALLLCEVSRVPGLLRKLNLKELSQVQQPSLGVIRARAYGRG